MVANVAGAVAWAGVMGTLGFFFGKPVAAILGHLGIWALVALAAVLILRFALRVWRSHRRRAPQTSPSATTEVGPPAELMAKPVVARVR
ncbi:MAG: hypothetical protein QOI57_225 [Rubrobacteraceae bacterium]|jgi:membrane protein DedA with SNARE-associated domain|nr:hypothetical protein [Rubrobacteraceae bacterium]